MTDQIDFRDVFLEDMGSLNKGQLRISEGNIKFLNDIVGKVMSVNPKEIKELKWLRLASKPGMRVLLKNGEIYRFGGFKDTDYDKWVSFAKKNWNYTAPIEQQDHCLKGWNFGTTQFVGQNVEFIVDNKPAFEVPLSNVSNVIHNKTEAVVEFHQNEDTPVALIEMRFHMPGQEDDDSVDPVEEFRQAVLKYAGVETDTGAAIAALPQILCTTPRGRYDIKIYANHVSLHGKTYDYKIPIKTIMRLFMLPHKDGRHLFFVISLNPPIRQGQTRYHYLVMEFSKEEHIDLEMGIPEDQLQELYGDKLVSTFSGPVHEIISQLFRVVANMKISVPANYNSASGTPAINCAHKQASGFLYPLEKGFMYIHKPPMYIRFDEIASVHFARSDVSTRSFDFEIEQKNGQTLVFNSVEKDEYNRLYDFVQNKHLRIRNAKRMDKGYKDDMFAGSDEEIDPYKEHVKKEGKDRQAANDDDESDSDDEDYDLDIDLAKRRKEREEHSSEGSESEPSEEWDSSAGSGTSEDELYKPDDDEARLKKKEKKEAAREKKEQKKKDGGEEGEGKSRKKRTKKDPNAPKRAQSAYFHWLNENRADIKKEGDAVSDTAKRAGEMWKAMTEEDKKPFEKKAADDKIRYEAEMKEWKDSGAAAESAAARKAESMASKEKKQKEKSTASSSKPTATATPTKSPSKAKSREYVDTSSGDSDSDAPLEKVKEKKTEKKPAKKEEEVKKEAVKKEADSPMEDSDSE